jgi:ATP-dependent exoDNAse (exonuclease V) beta subunit
VSDAAARAAITEALDTTIVVEASAGTGKTTALVERMLALIGSGRATLARIVAVTFTDKAAGEMKLRLRTRLEDARENAGPEARERFEVALSELETAHIASIHAFCAELLRKRPIEARIDPAFNVIAEEEERELLDRVFDRWLTGVLEDPPPGVRRALKRRGGDTPPSEKLRRAAHTLVEQRDFAAPWQRPPLDREPEIDRMLGLLTALADLGRVASNSRDMLGVNLRTLAASLLELEIDLPSASAETSSLGGQDYDRLEHALSRLLRVKAWKHKGYGQQYAEGLLRADILARREEVRVALEDLVARLDGEVAALLREELRDVVTAYDALKQEQGALDFLDLLLCTRDLLHGDAATRAELQAGITHVFIDEFQDIDALQADILLTLAAPVGSPLGTPPAAGKLFVVGDPKQSIYSFRRADVALYERVKRELVAQGALAVQLTRSYRATDAIQSAVNAAFSLAMPSEADGVQAAYRPLEPVRNARAEQPSVIALAVPKPYGNWGSLSPPKIAESTADAVAAFIDYLVTRSGFMVQDQGALVPVQSKHVLLLFRSTRAFGRELTRAYSRALEARRIPHVLGGGRSFHSREEVMALCAMLSAVEWPDDELAVYSTLRGPFFALTDAALLEHREAMGRLHPLAPQIPAETATAAQLEVAVALDVLRLAHYARNKQPIAHTVQALLAATRAHAGMAFWPSGEQALANVQRIVDDARRFDARAATSFRAFVARLSGQAERGEASGSGMLEEGSDGVRIMTVHGAKGLEHPIVILCEPTSPRRRDPSRYVDSTRELCAVPLCDAAPYELRIHRDELLAREHAEETRIAYVAATRARDLLVVPCVGDAKQEGWVDVLHPALYPSPSSKRSPSLAPGCPEFGDDSVLDWPASAKRIPGDSVAPGQHEPEHGEHRVVWWDPKALNLGAEPLGGVRQQELLADAGGSPAELAGAARLAAFEVERTVALEQAGQVSLRSLAITSVVKQDVERALEARMVTVQDVSIERVEIAESVAHARGARFGSLVHAVLASLLSEHVQTGRRERIDGDVLSSSIEAKVRWHARILGALPREQSAAIERVRAAWAHPLLVRACASKALWVELPVALRLPDQTLAEGAFDLAFREPDGTVTVIDLKTDDPEGNPVYAAQVSVYAQAITAATGKPARAVLLRV